MMWGDGYTMGWGWIAGGLVVLILIVVAVVAVVLASTRAGRAPGSETGTYAPGIERLSPRQILDERYAKGELTTDEYQERIQHLGTGA